MSEDEPTAGEFLKSIADIIISNRAMDIVRRKFQAQSYYQFFNRVWATSLLLFIIGSIGLGLFIISEEFQFSIFDMTNTLFLVGVIVLIWIILAMVGAINEGEDPIMGESGPNKYAELLKSTAGLTILVLLSYQMLSGSNSPSETLRLFILAAVLTSMWLLAFSWLLDGLSGLYGIYQSTPE